MLTLLKSLWRKNGAAPRKDSSRNNQFRPLVERLEDRLAPAAVRPGFDSQTLARNDDGSTGLVQIGFTVNFFGRTHSTAFVNNNGNITFGGSLGEYTPFPITTTHTEIIAPFFADVDTRRAGTEVKYGPGTVGGHAAFGVSYRDVDYFSSSTSHTNRNTFQVILINRSDTGPGNFDIEFNYDQIKWEAGTASDSNSSGLGGSSARAGFSNGTGHAGTFRELAGSAINGGFLDSNSATGLIHHSLNSSVLGRYDFFGRNGAVVLSVVSQFTNAFGQTIGPATWTADWQGTNHLISGLVAITNTGTSNYTGPVTLTFSAPGNPFNQPNPAGPGYVLVPPFTAGSYIRATDSAGYSLDGHDNSAGIPLDEHTVSFAQVFVPAHGFTFVHVRFSTFLAAGEMLGAFYSVAHLLNLNGRLPFSGSPITIGRPVDNGGFTISIS